MLNFDTCIIISQRPSIKNFGVADTVILIPTYHANASSPRSWYHFSVHFFLVDMLVESRDENTDISDVGDVRYNIGDDRYIDFGPIYHENIMSVAYAHVSIIFR